MSKESDLNWCEKDYYNRHCWQRVGVTSTRKEGDFIYYRCSQCCKYKRERIYYVIGGE